MDITTFLGAILFVLLVFSTYYTSPLLEFLVNPHAVFIVLGGTLAAILINTPLRYFLRTILEIRSVLFRVNENTPEKIIPHILALAEQCRAGGLTALREADPKVAGGFLNRAATAAFEYNDHNFVKKIMEEEINQAADDMNEIVNIYRTMSILAPMFGLLGTLLGIIEVLKEITNPESIGPAMAMAITSAFYGILFANLVCVPVAGKLRIKIWTEVKVKSMILEGVLEIMKGSVPIMIERRLESYIL